MTTLTADSQEVQDMISAYEENRNLASTWKCRIVAETRRKYILVDETDASDEGPDYTHRSGRFMIDRTDGTVYTIRGYGQRGHRVGTVAAMTESYKAGTASFRSDASGHMETTRTRVATW